MTGTKRPPPNLLRGMRAGQSRGALLTGGANPTFFTDDARPEDHAAMLLSAEERLDVDQSLWIREHSATSARAVLRAVEDGSELAERARRLLSRLDALDDAEFGAARLGLSRGTYSSGDFLKALAARAPFEHDAFAQRLLDVHRPPDRRTERAAGMVHYLPSPVASILELVHMLGPEDVFMDVGSGLGLVTALIAWLSPARVRGVEIEPAYHEVAVRRAEHMRLTNVEYLCADAREVDYSDCSVIYFFDSFRDALLETFIARVEHQGMQEGLRIVSRGASTPVFAAVPWLEEEKKTPSGHTVFRRRSGRGV